jgi:DNA-binding CsgD family transcriptional regulator
MVTTDRHLLERVEELAELRRVIGSARRGRGQAVVIDGPAGIGKTELLLSAHRYAKRAQMAILHARSDELERDFPFGIVRQLFDPVITAEHPQETELLGGDGALIAPVSDDEGEPRERLDSNRAYARLRDLYRLSEDLSRSAPLLISVDDAQRSDTPSLRWIAYLGHRIEHVPVALVVAADVHEPGGQHALLEHLRAEPDVSVLRPRRLSEQAVTVIVRAKFEARTEPGFSHACYLMTGGNPFLLRELLSESRVATLDEAARLSTCGLPGIVCSVVQRLARVPRPASELAQALAVLGDGASLPEAAALAGLEPDVADAAADTLAMMSLIEDDRPLRFVHPVIRAAIHANLPAGRRFRRHAAAARVVAGSGAGPEKIAMQLLAADPRGDFWASETLRSAAHSALARGAPEAAASYLRRALDEGPPEGLQSQLLFELGSVGAQVAARPALDQLKRAYAEAPNRDERAQRAVQLGQALAMADATREAADVILDGLAQVDRASRALRVLLETHLIGIARITRGLQGVVRERLPRVKRIAAPGSDAERAVLSELAFDAALTGTAAAEVRGIARHAFSTDPVLPPETNPLAFTQAIHALCLAGDYDFAWSKLESAASDAAGRGSTVELAPICLLQARLANAYGDVDDAERLATAALDRAVSHGWWLLVPLGVAALVEAQLARGDFAAAEALTRDHAPEARPNAAFVHNLLASRGRLRLLQGDAAGALADLRAAGASLEALDAPNPAVSPWRSLTAQAYAALGRMSEAKEVADEELELARRFGAAPALGVALRGRAVLETGTGRRTMLNESAAVLERSPARLEYAGTLTELGTAERRAGKRTAAREPLRRAVDIANACGAHAMAKRALVELVATGARPRRPALSGPESLTPSEHRVAELAVGGASNREIAAALVISTKTVETHLAHVYRKLEVRSRADLAGALEHERRRS